MNSNTPTNPPDVPAPAAKKHRVLAARMAVTEERKRIFLEKLAETGSFRYAAACASGHLVKAKGFRTDQRFGEATFAALAKRDPAFAEAVQAALNVAIGNAEGMLVDRMRTPDTRPILDKAGNIVGMDTNWRSANQLLLRFLERADDRWVQKKQIDGTQTVVHTDAEVGSGAAYVLKPNDILLLPPEKQATLLMLLEDIEAARQESPAALPAATPAALPGPTEDANGQP